MMKVLIGTKNPGKIEGATEALEEYFEDFEIEGIAVSSDVGDEPVNGEIYEGARNRVDNLMKYAEENKIEAEYFIMEPLAGNLVANAPRRNGGASENVKQA